MSHSSPETSSEASPVGTVEIVAGSLVGSDFALTKRGGFCGVIITSKG
jgi:hypothetical protein